jgi:beta-glucanase (GH16 family)
MSASGAAGSAGAASAAKAGYTLTFDDEFTSGTVPDPAVYYYYYTWGDQNNPMEDPAFLQGDTTTAGRAGYVGDARIISNGVLNITATQATARYGGQTFPYRTGMVRMKTAQRYGYFEIRAKLPPGQGLWPAFWLMPSVYDDSAIWEIDGFEAPSTAATSIYMNAHWGSGFGTATAMQNLSSFSGNFIDAFHVFGISWESDAIVWYVDGVERKRQTASGANIPPVPMQLICNLEIGGSWPGSPDSTTPFPAVYQVDYIRVYRKN